MSDEIHPIDAALKSMRQFEDYGDMEEAIARLESYRLSAPAPEPAAIRSEAREEALREAAEICKYRAKKAAVTVGVNAEGQLEGAADDILALIDQEPSDG